MVFQKIGKVFANPINVIFLFLIITVFGIGITISFINYNFLESQETQKSIEETQQILLNLTKSVERTEVQDDLQTQLLLHQILNVTTNNTLIGHQVLNNTSLIGK